MQPLTLDVSVDQANLILEGLGKLPFAQVYELIAQLQKQARTQLARPAAAAPAPTPVAGIAGPSDDDIAESGTPRLAAGN